MDKMLYRTYVDILKEELIPAMGCTEPIAVAYAGAIAREQLGRLPEKVELTVSGNIVKNVKSVIVPNTSGRKGLRTAVSAGICYGVASKQLEVISEVTAAQLEELDRFLDTAEISINKSTYHCPFDIQVRVYAGDDQAYAHIFSSHTNVVEISKNGECVFKKDFSDEIVPVPESRKLLTVNDIVDFALEVDIKDIRPVISRQIEYNMRIAQVGMDEKYGASIGKTLLRSYGGSVHNRAKAYAAAGSDARMNGCELPVVINSGSGNQGMTVSIPVVIYARELGVSEDMLYRALVISNLISIHIKTGIGSLSAYCGATSAGVGAGAGICYLYGGGAREIRHTIVNALAINSGMICDGAKSSCAAKIASAVEAGLLGMQMDKHDRQFYDGDGIVIKGVENTIKAVGEIAREGMRGTDDKIIDIMMQN
ncbi:MAG: serine dehydratase subunit alpha family protein [Mogibacterium sp.]|nr:serine dehydratase subunit alpha family protein [Mogibacterium sp.]